MKRARSRTMRSRKPVKQPGVALVVGDGEQPASLVVPGQRLFIVAATGSAHGGGERGEGGLGQKALVVAPGAGRGVVVGGDMVGWPGGRRAGRTRR